MPGPKRIAKIKVTEVGPYTYRETWTKTDIAFDKENDLVEVEFQLSIYFRQDEEANS